MNDAFWVGFEKEAGIKHWLASGALATNIAAHAGDEAKAAKTTFNAVKHTNILHHAGKEATKATLGEAGEKAMNAQMKHVDKQTGALKFRPNKISANLGDADASINRHGVAKLNYKDVGIEHGKDGLSYNAKVSDNTSLKVNPQNRSASLSYTHDF